MKTLINSANYGATIAEAEQHLAAFEPFHTGTLSGFYDGDTYVVESYGVVIAECDYSLTQNNFHVYAHAYNFSVTTSRHANLVKKAWGI